MKLKMPIALTIISIIAILIDCYAGYALFLMTAMPIGHYLSPILLLFFVVLIPALFISSIVGLFKFRKWGYFIFFVLTIILNSFLTYMVIYDLTKGYINIRFPQIFLIVFFLVFIIYFLRPSIRRLFS